jgi:hypothetical protein
MRRAGLIVPLFALLSGAIAWGVLGGAREARLEALLEEIEAAETRVAYSGVREIGSGEGPAIRVSSRGDGRRHVEILKRPRRPAPPGPLLSGFTQWKERVKDYRLAVRNYEIVPLGLERVAGREAEVYEARPRHPGRPTFRVAADRVHRLALRFEVFSEGKRHFRAEFTEIDFSAGSPVPDAPARPSWLALDARALPPERLGEAAGFQVWVPSRPPAGFELKKAELVRLDVPEEARRALPLPLPKLNGSLVHLAYTDGLALLVVLEVDARSELWALARRFLPQAEKSAAGVLVHKVKGPGGWACLLEVEGTAVLVAGNVSETDIERTVESLERR